MADLRADQQAGEGPHWPEERSETPTDDSAKHCVLSSRVGSLFTRERGPLVAVPASGRLCVAIALVAVATNASGEEVVEVVATALRARDGMFDLPGALLSRTPVVGETELFAADMAIAARPVIDFPDCCLVVRHWFCP